MIYEMHLAWLFEASWRSVWTDAEVTTIYIEGLLERALFDFDNEWTTSLEKF